MTLPFDPAPTYAGLKDFQQDTVEHVFRRMYLDADPARRFLVADEVGLGKTLVARGLIAKTIEHLWEDKERIDVLYICSNADIARQNVARLNVTSTEDFTVASRLTLLPKELRHGHERPLNFVSFTPQTSFDVRGGLGRVDERVLLFKLLERVWGREFMKGTGPERLLAGQVELGRFRRLVQRFDPSVTDRRLAEDFRRALRDYDKRMRDEYGEQRLRTRFKHVKAEYRYPRRQRSQEERAERREVVGELRHVLAKVCIDILRPDLVILDEFQRFRSLLEGDDDAAELAKALFEYEDVRVLLLSATPYQMYTLHGEEAGEDHYRELINILVFLGGQESANKIAEEFRRYRRELLRLGEDGDDAGAKSRRALERQLGKVMARTERLAVGENRNGMLTDRPLGKVRLDPRDLQEYLVVHELCERLEVPDPLEIWKSAPYLLNFMEGYQLKRRFDAALDRGGHDLERLLEDWDGVLHWEDVRDYREIDPGNGRLRAVTSDVLDGEAWRLLWIAPSLPYHELGPPFDAPGLRGFTKRLVFSSWKVVPKVISTMLSYEVERRIGSARPGERRPYDDRQNTPQLLRIQEARGRLTGMPVFSLMYPSPVLARLGDPREIAASHRTDAPLGVEELRGVVRERVGEALEEVYTELEVDRSAPGPTDDSWYWAAPLLLDRLAGRGRTSGRFATTGWNQDWWAHENFSGVWIGEHEQEEDAAEDASSWVAHVEYARDVLGGRVVPEGRPPDDLADVVADLAIAGPGVAALRALSRIGGGPDALISPHVRDDAAAVAWRFRNLFNLPEAIAIVRGTDLATRDEHYWRRVLDYCVNGCLQAVLDEYAHVLVEWLGELSRHPEDATMAVADAMRKALSVRAAPYRVDELSRDGNGVTTKPRRMRGHFAIRFGDERAEDGQRISRAATLLTSFNSPFWPFVLATTSIGQEGLDFHLYCHHVVHWNLPQNPVDLEQREGRVHRFKGHAVRKNVAQACAEAVFEGEDPWTSLFEAAGERRGPEDSELIPFWVFEGDATIERSVPRLPLSRDEGRFDDLRRTLGAYRLAFGQPRQEDLVRYLQRKTGEGGLDEALEDLRIDLSPKARRRRPRVPRAAQVPPLRRGRRASLVHEGSLVWDKDRFFAELERNRGKSEAEVAEEILQWAMDRYLHVQWGRGKDLGAFSPMVKVSGEFYPTFSVDTNGSVALRLKDMARGGPFADRSRRRELLHRLNEIKGISLDESRVDRYPAFPLAKLKDGTVLSRFAAEWDRVVMSLREGTAR